MVEMQGKSKLEIYNDGCDVKEKNKLHCVYACPSI